MSSIPFQHRKHWGAFAILMLLTVVGSLGSNIPLAFQIFSAVLVAPYVISIPLLYRVIMEYNPGSRMRRAWVLMMWCAGFSVLRHLLDFVSSLVNVRLGMQIRDISLVATLLSISIQLLSMILLWSCFRGLGIQRPFTWTNRILMAIVAVFVVFCFIESSSFPHSGASSAFFRYLEFLNPVVFVVSTVVGLLLYRLSEDIGASDFGLSVLFLVLQLFARISGFAFQTLARRLGSLPLAHVSNIFYWIYPWLFFWAILFRWQIIGSVMRTVQFRGETRREFIPINR